jgi:hypothetical protein
MGKVHVTPRSHSFCSFCGRSQVDARKLVAGPGVWICEQCLASARRVMIDSTPIEDDLERFALAAPDDHNVRCNFCGNMPGRVEHIVTGGSPLRGICGRCLKLCEEVIEHRSATNPDIAHWDAELEKVVAAALGPATVVSVAIDSNTRTAHVVVPKDQLSLAIGRDGEKARLAATPTGWRVDIKSVENGVAQDQT